jgi:hypothetical protein
MRTRVEAFFCSAGAWARRSSWVGKWLWWVALYPFVSAPSGCCGEIIPAITPGYLLIDPRDATTHELHMYWDNSLPLPSDLKGQFTMTHNCSGVANVVADPQRRLYILVTGIGATSGKCTVNADYQPASGEPHLDTTGANANIEAGPSPLRVYCREGEVGGVVEMTAPSNQNCLVTGGVPCAASPKYLIDSPSREISAFPDAKGESFRLEAEEATTTVPGLVNVTDCGSPADQLTMKVKVR